MRKVITHLPVFCREQGVALITVMLVVALAATIATQMLGRLQFQVQRATNISFNQQAYWYAMGAEALATRVLSSTFNKEPDITHLGQIWAQGEQSYPVDFGTITGEISDLQACLNLNALRPNKNNNRNVNPRGNSQSTNGNAQNPSTSTQGASASPANVNNNPNTISNSTAASDALERLILSLNVEGIDNFSVESMVDALIDWLDEDDSLISPSGAEDNDYAAKPFPYVTANNYLASVNELRLVEHFTIPVINALKEYVCVIPNSDLFKMNINTIPVEKAELLHAVLNIPTDDAQQILSDRDEEGFEKLQEFYDLPEITKLNLNDQQKEYFVVDSEYFTLKASSEFNSSFFYLNSILAVGSDNNIRVISRKIGRD